MKKYASLTDGYYRLKCGLVRVKNKIIYHNPLYFIENAGFGVRTPNILLSVIVFWGRRTRMFRFCGGLSGRSKAFCGMLVLLEFGSCKQQVSFVKAWPRFPVKGI